MGVTSDDRERETSYVVLAKDSHVSQEWFEAGTFSAKSADGAIRKAGKTDGIYVAVPARSWKPMRVEQVQTVQTVITAADETPEPEPVDQIKPGPLEDTA